MFQAWPKSTRQGIIIPSNQLKLKKKEKIQGENKSNVSINNCTLKDFYSKGVNVLSVKVRHIHIK